jgi:hypothetical protein
MPSIVADPVISLLCNRAHTEANGHQADYRYLSHDLSDHQCFPQRAK